MNKTYNITIEGNIAAGKSTLLKYLDNFKDCQIVWEPIDSWKDIGNQNLLNLWYTDPKQYSMSFQSYIQLTMLKNHLLKTKKPYKIMERSLFSAQHCFISNLRTTNRLSQLDYNILKEWHDYIIELHQIKVDLIVYLKTNPAILFDRIKKRNRIGERSITLEYLQQIHNLHESWLGNGANNVLTIEANANIEVMMKKYANYMVLP